MGGATPVAAAAASSRPLFFLAAFDDLDGDGFILQEQSVFTRIRSGATLKSFGWRRTWIYYGGSVRWEQIYLRWKRNGYSSNG
jgi:hypothetical protein